MMMKITVAEAWLEFFTAIRQKCELSARARELGVKPVIHFYEPMLPLAFEREYPWSTTHV
jgi:hypothetical protein